MVAVPALAQSIDNTAGDAPQQREEQPPESRPDPDAIDQDINTILVIGARLAERVDAPEPPILELDAEDIAAYGAGSIAELLQQLGPQVNSARGRGGSGGFGGGGGRPIVLVNGVRIASFRELRSYPPEAIERTEVFTEEVAQRYGYSPDQRVVNFILKDNFSSRELEFDYGQPFDGGFSSQEVEATYLRIDGPSRLNVNIDWENTSPLTEAERGIIQTEGSVSGVAGDPDPAAFRTLVADSNQFEATANWSMRLGESRNALSLNGTYEQQDSLRLQGLDSVFLTDSVGNSALRTFNADDPLTLDSSTQSYSFSSALNVYQGDWEITGTLDGTYSDTRNRIGARVDASDLVTDASLDLVAIDGALPSFAEAGFDEALSDTYTFNALATARGIPLVVPAGDVAVTFRAGYRWNSIESSDTRALAADTDLSRSRIFGGANISIPLTSGDEDVLGAVGDFTLNINAGLAELSDFGTLTDYTIGLTWGVTDRLTLTANSINREVAPSLSQLGNPAIATPNVPIFDIVNNETVLATVISGGNPDLPAQQQSDWSFGLIWSLPFIDNGSLSINYFDNHSDDVTSSFPVLTSEIEAAFPGRITRDATGRLDTFDRRFVTFAERDEQRLQFGLNFNGSFGGGGDSAAGGPPPSGEGQRGPQDGPQGGGRGAGGPPNPERFAQLQATFCETDSDQLLDQFNRVLAAQAAGEEPPLGADGEPINIPPRMLQRLAGEDGQVDPQRFAMIRERICSAEGPAGGPPAGQTASSSQPQGGPPSGARQGRPGGPGAGQGRRGGGVRGLGRANRLVGGGDGPPVARWFFGLNYELELENTVLIADGVPELDLLDGDALTGGGDPRHSANLRAGLFYDGFGVIAFANYTGSSRIDGTGLPGSTDLFYDDLVRVNLRGFVDLGARDSLVAAVPFLSGVRMSLRIDNLFDARQTVIDSSGAVPTRFQPFLIDPVGRRFEIGLRKLF